MARFRNKITIEKFNEKLTKFITDGNLTSITPQIYRDLSKVKFDWENFTCDCGFYGGIYPCGIEEIAEDFPVLWCNAGGDWEIPIIFILYWSGKNIRGYIPKEGNVYNRRYNTAFGSEPSPCDGPTTEQAISMILDKEAMIRDILLRIQI